jgi:hypothetical protein
MAGRWKAGALALGLVAASTGCVERVIHDVEGVAGGEGGQVDTDTDTDTDPGDTLQVPPSETETATDTDPDVECMIAQDCGDDQTCYQGVCVGTGNVRVSLSWSVVTDLDLHLRLPNGDSISYENPITAYGELDVDDCVGGACINQDGVHVENIFLGANAPRGTYEITIVNFDGRRAADYGVEVAGEVSASFAGHLPADDFYAGMVHQFIW